MLIEALSCGILVVASDSGEIPYVVGDAGVIVSERGQADWTDAINALADDPARRFEASQPDLERPAIHAWPFAARKHLDLLEELLSDQPAARHDSGHLR